MLDRRHFLLAAGAAVLTGCDTGPVPSADPSAQAAVKAKAVPGSGEATGVRAMKITETELVLKPGMGRPFAYGSIAPAQAHAMLQRKTKAALNAANPGGTRPTRARIELRAITIAEKVRGRRHYDSVIFAMVRFFDIATGAQVGEETRMGVQATYRPGFLGGYDRVLPPEQELALITTHSAKVLAETVYK